jgi:hypothetical protein
MTDSAGSPTSLPSQPREHWGDPNIGAETTESGGLTM